MSGSRNGGLRVLLVANTLPPDDLSGVGEQVMQLARGLREAGHEVEILGRGPRGARGSKLLFPFTLLPAFLRARRRFRPHVVQVHESDGAAAAFATSAFRQLWQPIPVLIALLQVSYVEEMRAVRPLRDGKRVLGRPGGVERRFLWTKAPLQVLLGWLTGWCADCVLTPSVRTGEEIRRDYGVTATSVLPNVKARIGERSPRDEDDGTFLFVGRLRIRKGVEVLFDALRRLRRGDSNPRLTIVGDGEHRAALEATARSMGVERCVDFHGRADADEVRAMMRGARALVVPSTYEGMPLVVLEAMEEGLPVIASAVSGIPEVVSDRVTGWLVPPEDPTALATALEEAWRDGAEARRRGAAGRRRLDECYRPRHAVEAWQRRIEALPASHRPAETEGDSDR